MATRKHNGMEKECFTMPTLSRAFSKVVV